VFSLGCYIIFFEQRARIVSVFAKFCHIIKKATVNHIFVGIQEIYSSIPYPVSVSRHEFVVWHLKTEKLAHLLDDRFFGIDTNEY
jgi:hypothetical protein